MRKVHADHTHIGTTRLPSPVDVVFELDTRLTLVRLFADEWMLEKLLRTRALMIVCIDGERGKDAYGTDQQAPQAPPAPRGQRTLPLIRQFCTKEENFWFHLRDLSLGGGLRGMRKSARMGCMSQRGGCPSAISKAVMPKDHRSLLRKDKMGMGAGFHGPFA